MAQQPHFLIIDGYPEKSRDQLQESGMKLAGDLFAAMLLQNLPQATYQIIFPGDPGVKFPNKTEMEEYQGILWTGCNLSLLDKDNPRVICQVEFAQLAYEVGVPSYGSCWALQIAAVAAGGEVKENPKGREMGMARKISLTDEARNHPMFTGRSTVFEAFISHDDEVTKLPPGGVRLAGNSFTNIQALAVEHKKGAFWATQYHPEYDLHEMARLIVARESKLVPMGFFKGHDELMQYVDDLETLFANPERKDLRWKLAIDDDVLCDRTRQNEFINWLEKLVLPKAG